MLERLDLAAPWVLLLLPVVLAILWHSRRRGRRRVAFGSVALVAGLPASLRRRLAWLPAAAFACGVVLAVVALARPRLGDERTVVRTEGVAIALVVDTSSSMLAHDFTDAAGEPTDRLSAVKAVVREFVAGGDALHGRAGDLVGLTVFAGYAQAVCPPTLDHGMVLTTLAATEIAQSEVEDGTSIGLGLAVALQRIRDIDVPSRVVVLLTDGENRDDDNPPLAAAQAAREMGVRVHTIGMGTRGLAPYPQQLADGRVIFRQVPVSLDEDLLQAIASTTGGKYQRAGTTDGLRRIYADIDAMERTELEGVTYRRHRELFTYPLAAAALLWLLSLIGEATLFRRLG